MSGPGPLLRAARAAGLDLLDVMAGVRDREGLDLFRDLSDWTPAEEPDRDFWAAALRVALACPEPAPFLAWLRRAAAVEALDLWLEYACDPRTDPGRLGPALDHLGLEDFRHSHFHTAIGVGLDGVARDLDFRGLRLPRTGLSLTRCHGVRRLVVGPPPGESLPGLVVVDCARLAFLSLAPGSRLGRVRIERCPALEQVGPWDFHARELCLREAPALRGLPSDLEGGEVHLRDLPSLEALPERLVASRNLVLEGLGGPPDPLVWDWTAEGLLRVRGLVGVRRFRAGVLRGLQGLCLEDWPDLEALEVDLLESRQGLLLRGCPRLRRVTGALRVAGACQVVDCPSLAEGPRELLEALR